MQVQKLPSLFNPLCRKLYEIQFGDLKNAQGNIWYWLSANAMHMGCACVSFYILSSDLMLYKQSTFIRTMT